jgi:hypothetical protein
MGTLYAIYVRVSDPATADALLSEYPGAYTEPGMQFYAVDDPLCGYPPPESELLELSVRLAADVLWLAFQSVVDAFEYHHWRAGAHLRSLVFGCYGQELTWERSEGQPEPWEREAIFDRGDLAIWMEGATEDERREYERIWSDAVLSTGQMVPCLDARETARKVAEYYRLPGWYLNDEIKSP